MEVLLFGIARDIVGQGSLSLSADGNTVDSVAALKQMLADTYPEFGKLSSLAVAVNSEYANDDLALHPTDEIAIIPPVSGG